MQGHLTRGLQQIEEKLCNMSCINTIMLELIGNIPIVFE